MAPLAALYKSIWDTLGRFCGVSCAKQVERGYGGYERAAWVVVFTESAPVTTRSGCESGEGVMASGKEEKEWG